MIAAELAPAVRYGRYVVEEVTAPERFEALRGEWNALLARGAADAPFARHEWIAAFLRHLAPGAPLRILVARSADGSPMGIAPLVEERRGLGERWLVSPVNPHSCRYEWVLGEDAPGAMAALWGHLRERSWSGLLLKDVVRDGPTSAHLERLARADGFPVGRWQSLDTPFVRGGPRAGGPIHDPLSTH
jgi:hypothetical protein